MKFQISDDYFIGFVEGEGSFLVSIVPSRGTSRTKSGWQVIYFFKVSQNPSGKIVLEQLKERLGCGYIKRNGSRRDLTDKSLAYIVRDISSLKDKVIPFFDERLVIKRRNFEKFKRVIELVVTRQHLTPDGMREVLDIAYSMNTRKRKISKKEILKVY
ncbi:MAG: hypothetical protein A3D24_03140 [Candidatus Blackburnbacteria bacterium RIFCSPHIGHO2_02_FULL_39_13]|uniref:Homing endonuclease LAGLIDADG domain-containing protein n=1 Tax=Candidatus Blackburnbacteria bacterium RIFCSPLOWO2_01_FULL_40_20 TaxID=1797519 RepID=A0A1G1VFP2_9BACT|nr:MAG: hypothetical protein A2694_04440 [Candidatus Blackburnbacteria bacterium RIFCSPHIGHO2_01_FULL_40_17]OGY08827.1 MAG: hypothetical protein A3D24_03140 [Candidatus Blackburnbacteria bacterium RIFCSPHIGHO2_02_FULL_39_13]OGY14201.1 MAG: hypothetical protein A3A77_01830 [Candidatus Blackburnbacteria bacterium RIFCSPLOWO2_01_FULL_40_20]HBL51694.1 hypothetical protein [Candidatus Blackburnbacteria bacterium]